MIADICWALISANSPSPSPTGFVNIDSNVRSYAMKFLFGWNSSLLSWPVATASSKLIFPSAIIYAQTKLALRLMPLVQWTSTLFVLFSSKACLMNSFASVIKGIIFYSLSSHTLSNTRYLMPSCWGVAAWVTLKMCVIPFFWRVSRFAAASWFDW